MADGRHHARVDDLPNRRKGAVAFRREGDHADGSCDRIENAVDLGGVRVAHQRRLVGAAALGGEPGPFEMDAVEQAAANVVGQLPDLAQQVGRARGDQRGDERGGAVPAVKCDGGCRFGVRRGGEVRPSPAVQMRVDEARHHRHRAESRGPRGGAERLRRPRRRCRCETSIHPGRNSSRPVSRVSAVNSTQMPCHSGLER